MMVNPFVWLVITVIDLYIWIVIIGVVLSWLVAFNVVNSSNRLIYIIGDFTHRFTNPVLRRIRQYIPNIGGMDISPVLLLICLIFLQRLILWNAY
ncbi:MAG: YggT family protein [Pseudomonadota bacterium]|nr:YggT family protein [Pseudomonadota bacterium]